MPRFTRILTLAAAVLAAATLATAQTPTPTKAPAMKAAAKTTAAKPAKAATSLVATGKVGAFDAAGNMLTVTPAKGAAMMFMLTPTTKITEGTKALKTTDLATVMGQKATVHYTTSGGMNNVTSIRVVAPAAPKAAAKKPTATPTTKK